MFNKYGILGINARNLLYIRPFNKEKSIEIADDKLKTKAFLSARGIPVPKLLGVVNTTEEIEKFKFKKLGHEFVLKPNMGFGGEGIIPIYRRENLHFVSSKNKIYTPHQLKEHMKDILAGNYSINGNPDKAFFEKLIQTDEILGKYCYQGLPDIRVIVHNLVPVMAMLRLPTRESDGKANLHQGAIGAGIDLAKGEVTYCIYKNEIIREIPEFGPIKGLKIPFWDDILQIACKAQLSSNLGYMGADMAIDRYHGPILLEINARAGISIQMANQAPLRKRLEKLEGLHINNIEKGIRIGKDMFGNSIEKTIKNISGKKVLGLFENIEILHNKTNFKSIAFLNTARKKNYLSTDLAKHLGLIKSKKNLPKDLKFKLKYKIGKITMTSYFKIDRNIRKKYGVILGNKDLSGLFLIDTSKNNLISEKNSGKKTNIFISNYDPLETDRAIFKINNQIKLLSYFRPLNFQDETQKFLQDNTVNPQFIYKDFPNDEYLHFLTELDRIKHDDTEIGRLFANKINELKNYIELIRLRGTQEFSGKSVELFGLTNSTEAAEILSHLQNNHNPKNLSPKMTSEQVRDIFAETLASYGLSNTRILLSDKILSKCISHKNRKILLKKNTTFRENRIRELIIHEIETHLLTSENGSRQKFKLFNAGFANYLETQEGLALYNSYTQSNSNQEERHKELLTLAIHYGQTMSFSELYQAMRKHGLNKKSALNVCVRIKRGITDTSQPGAFTKDYTYYKGKKDVEEFVKKGGDLRDLYLGKYNLRDLEAIKRISSFKVPPILPNWLK